jgi:hypothetical protein
VLSVKANSAQFQASRKNTQSPTALKLIAETAEAVVDQEKLRDQRCAAEEIDIAIGEPDDRKRFDDMRPKAIGTTRAPRA